MVIQPVPTTGETEQLLLVRMGKKTETKPANAITEEALSINTNFLSLFSATDFNNRSEKDKTSAETGP